MSFSTDAVLAVIIFEFILIALAPMIIELTDTTAGSPLENASAMSKTVYSLVPLFYAILALAPIIALIKFGRK